MRSHAGLASRHWGITRFALIFFFCLRGWRRNIYTRITLTMVTFVVCLIQIFLSSFQFGFSVYREQWIEYFSLKERKKKYETSNVLSIKQRDLFEQQNNFSLVFHSYTLCNFHFIDRLLFIFNFISSIGGTFNDNDSTAHDVGKMSLFSGHTSSFSWKYARECFKVEWTVKYFPLQIFLLFFSFRIFFDSFLFFFSYFHFTEEKKKN